MTDARRPLVAGNWKMNGVAASLCEIDRLAELLRSVGDPGCDVLVCPPATLIDRLRGRIAAAGASIQVGAQDCHTQANGAHTGDISADMLADAGASTVIVGHSERRQDHGEADALVQAKAGAAHAAGLTAIVCIGETLEQRDAGQTLDVVTGQISASLPDGASAGNTVLAYEPVWAIGTGRTPSVEDVAAVHGAIRSHLSSAVGAAAAAAMRVLYGGSVKPANAAELMAAGDVDGALVGGASLRADDFWGIIGAYRS